MYGDSPYNTQMWWWWCKSSSTPTWHDCDYPVLAQWGEREDVPQPGLEFDGGYGRNELAVYRPSTKQLYWKQTASPYQSGTISLVDVGDPLVHLHGLYDGDLLTDVVVYEPQNARFYIYKSSTVPPWDYAQRVVRTFPADLIPDAIAATDAGPSAPQKRAGGVPLRGGRNYQGRRILQVWDANTGDWYTMWDPVGSATLRRCQWGMTGDQPFSGFLDRDDDGNSDFAVFRADGSGAGDAKYMHIRSSSDGVNFDCDPWWAGNYVSIPVGAGLPRSVVSGVSDMNGDGKGDILIYSPDPFEWSRYYSSGPTWVGQATLQVGNVMSVGL